MKYICQLDYPDWLFVTRTGKPEGPEQDKGKTTTVSRSGCGLCSSIMVADRLLPESTFGLKEAIRLAYDTQANHSVGLDYKIYAPAFAENLNFDLEMTSDPEQLRYCLRTGGAAVIHASGDREGHVGLFTHRGHYIAAVSEERDGRIVILDPSYKEGKFEEEGRQGLVEVKNGVMAICDMQTILDNTVNRLHPFYLFWRK